MTFDEVLAQVQALLQQEKRVSYRGLKRRFALDDEYLEDLKEELIGAKQIATDEDGRFLVWAAEEQGRRGKGTNCENSRSCQFPGYRLSVLSPQPLAPSLRPAERRQLTVMFCDLVGSTASRSNSTPKSYARWCEPIKRPVQGDPAIRRAYCPALGRWLVGLLWLSIGARR